ncbi:MAG: LD-carboxypeptidase [Cyanobacteria bacterium P01_A01_bin.135]
MTSRRKFLATATVAALASLAHRAPAQAQLPSAAVTALLPPRLRPGDTVGVLSPAGAMRGPQDLEITVQAIADLGLVPRLGAHTRDRYGYLAGQDRDRAADINQLFADPTVKALMPIRGDWGSARVLPYLDYEMIRQNPKILVGFSDITALLLGIYAQTGLVTFHGPHGVTSWSAAQTQPFRQVLFDGGAIALGAAGAGASTPGRTIVPGRAQGPLIGGNLSVLVGILGSPYMPDLTGAILFLEDVGEAVYRVDRMLTQMKLARTLDGLAGIVFGQCTRCSAENGSLTLDQVLRDHLQPLGIPAWSGALLGHVEPILTVPIGGEVVMDAGRGLMQMVGPAVA